MKIEEIQLYSYNIPIIQPLRIGKTFVRSRSGVIIQISTNTNIYGFGEAAPLPGLHQENLNSVKSQLNELKSILLGTPCSGFFEFLDNFQKQKRISPSVRFALESAILNIDDQVSQSGKYKILPGPARRTIYVNALATGDDESAILKKIEKSISEKYRSIKIKVGRKSVETEINLISNIRSMVGYEVSLRLDANQAWDLEEAVTFAKSVKDLEIEYIEEPLKETGKLATFYGKTGIPIALDESLNEMLPESIESKKWINTLILKPAVIGSVRKILRFLNQAKKFGQNIVISDTFHSGIGLSFMIRLASILDEPTPMGFDTYQWLKDDILVNRLPVKDGYFDLNTVMNLCHKVDNSKIEKIMQK